MMVQVLRPFSAATPVKAGDILDASAWPVNRVRQLTRFRFVQVVATTAELAKADGRKKAHS